MGTNAQRQVQPIQLFDAASALQLSQTKDTINNIFYDLCGLQQVKEGDSFKVVRVSRPTFTYEFTKELSTKLYIAINRITGRTTFSNAKTDLYLEKNCDTLANWFAVKGIHRLISQEAWKRIISLTKIDPDTIVKDDVTKKISGLSFWQSKYGVTWDYDSQVNDYMLDIVKDEFNLREERFGQDTILRDVFWKVQTFFEGGLNRSLNNLTLDHEKIIHKESTVIDNKQDNRSNEGFIEKTKTNLGKMFGRGS